MLSRIKSIFTRNKIGAISIQVATDMSATHRRQMGLIIMRERSSIRARVTYLDQHIATAHETLAALNSERDQLEAQYAAVALELSCYGYPGLEMSIAPGTRHDAEVA